MASRRNECQPVICDITMKHKTPVSANSSLMVEFLKLLIYQKGQIPVPYQQLKAYISSVDQEVVNFEEEKNNMTHLVAIYFP